MHIHVKHDEWVARTGMASPQVRWSGRMKSWKFQSAPKRMGDLEQRRAARPAPVPTGMALQFDSCGRLSVAVKAFPWLMNLLCCLWR